VSGIAGPGFLNKKMKKICFILCLLTAAACTAQTDTIKSRGTIKIGKPKTGEVYIKAIALYDKYDVVSLKQNPVEKPFQPFPVVEGYAYPFNYTRYFRESFEGFVIDLKGKEADTVMLEIKVLSNGKAYVKDKSKTMLVKGVPAVYDEKEAAYELNSLHIRCIGTLKKIKQWMPGYVILPKKEKFRSQTVIKPEKKNVDASGTIMIIFSTTPFDE
jgi:hypothetical protein